MTLYVAQPAELKRLISVRRTVCIYLSCDFYRLSAGERAVHEAPERQSDSQSQQCCILLTLTKNTEMTNNRFTETRTKTTAND